MNKQGKRQGRSGGERGEEPGGFCTHVLLLYDTSTALVTRMKNTCRLEYKWAEQPQCSWSPAGLQVQTVRALDYGMLLLRMIQGMYVLLLLHDVPGIGQLVFVRYLQTGTYLILQPNLVEHGFARLYSKHQCRRTFFIEVFTAPLHLHPSEVRYIHGFLSDS